jgi:hypothetical protein
MSYNLSKESCGKNNILATYFACDDIAGLSSHTIIGKAVLVRLDGPNGNPVPVDLTRDEEIRTGLFLNDLMDTYDDDLSPEKWKEIFQPWK